MFTVNRTSQDGPYYEHDFCSNVFYNKIVIFELNRIDDDSTLAKVACCCHKAFFRIGIISGKGIVNKSLQIRFKINYVMSYHFIFIPKGILRYVI